MYQALINKLSLEIFVQKTEFTYLSHYAGSLVTDYVY